MTTGHQVSTAEQARAEGLGRAGQSTWGWDPHPNPTLSTGSLPCPQRHPPQSLCRQTLPGGPSSTWDPTC